MTRVELKDPTLTLESLLKAAESEPVVLTENGQARFVIEPADEFAVADLQIARNAAFRESVQRAREQWERGEAMSHEDVLKRYGSV